MEKNPKKFKMDDVELGDRRAFVERTKVSVRVSKKGIHVLLIITSLQHILRYSELIDLLYVICDTFCNVNIKIQH